MALFLLVTLFFLLALTLRAMKRLWRAQLLRMLAAFMRRGLPLEPSLAALGVAGSGAGEERLVGRLALLLSQGKPLPEALRRLRVISRQQALALEVAHEHGAAPDMLSEFAAQATRSERYVLQANALVFYATGVGTALFCATSFIWVFIIPKMEQMFKEMEIAAPVTPNCNYCLLLVGALAVWGLLMPSLHAPRLGPWLWWYVPVLGACFRMYDQAKLARNVGLMLRAGATLERAVLSLADGGAGGPLQRRLLEVCDGLQEGAPPAQAFRSAGGWREEFLWALDSAAQGVPPGPLFEQVAQVLEDKAAARINAVYRVCTPLAVLTAATGVGLLGWTVFTSLSAISRSFMQ